ncbi:MAG: intradiol ring-cleavage dioxygenase [Chloroflexi bacterium]|nr:intradiol ring-cleavage dioxygenase [Chloroflexota bacterium]
MTHDEYHDDDAPVGRVLTRREALKLLGGVGVVLLGGIGCNVLNYSTSSGSASSTEIPAATEAGVAAVPTCIVRPALTEGPYFVDVGLNRSDIRADANGNSRDGLPLYLTFHVLNLVDNACSPIEGAQVDVWHCDADGVYSGVQDPSFNTSNEQWLRGYQLTDASGAASFTTIYPGWYPGRAVHIHFKVRTDPQSNVGYDFTSQLFFDETVTDEVFANAPYPGKGVQYTSNGQDGIFQGSNGLLTLNTVKDTDGYKADFSLALDLT